MIKEDFKTEDQELVGRLGFALNPLLEQVYLIFSKRITISENMDQEFKEVALEVNEFGAPVNSLSFTTTISKVNAIYVADIKVVKSSSSLPISSLVAGTSTLVTTSLPHGYTTGQVVTLSLTDSTPNVNGSFKIVVKNDTMFEVPKLTTIGGTSGNVVSLDGSILGSPYVMFRHEGKILKLQQISGLNPNTKYKIKFWIIGQ